MSGSPSSRRRRRVLAAAACLVGILSIGAASGQMNGVSRSIGEVIERMGPATHREAVSPDDLVATEGSSATAAPPEALAFGSSGTAGATVGQASDGREAAETAPTAAVAAAVAPAPQAPVAPSTTVASPTTSAPPEPTTSAPPIPTTTTTVASSPAPSPEPDPERTTIDVRVSTDGTIQSGPDAGRPIADVLRSVAPGTRFVFEPGSHPALEISGVNGTDAAPIVFAALDPADPPTFTDGSYTARAGLHVTGSSHVELRDLRVRNALWGVRVVQSEHIELRGLDVRDIGQEGIRVAERSRHVAILNSTIADTGQRRGTGSDGQPFSLFGEGIYLGTGKTEADPVSHVDIVGNRIFNTGTEAIDVKAPVSHVTIRNNQISDIRTGTSGAVVVHLASGYSATDTNIRIEGNTITNISTSTQWRDGVGIVVGSSVDIVGNTFASLQHHAIRVEDGGSQGGNIRVRVLDNRFSDVGQDVIWAARGVATIERSGNVGL